MFIWSETFVVRMQRKLYRSGRNAMLLGVCAGLAEYFQIDVTLVRLLYVVATLFSGVIVGVLVYLIAAVLMPLK